MLQPSFNAMWGEYSANDCNNPAFFSPGRVEGVRNKEGNVAISAAQDVVCRCTHLALDWLPRARMLSAVDRWGVCCFGRDGPYQSDIRYEFLSQKIDITGQTLLVSQVLLDHQADEIGGVGQA